MNLAETSLAAFRSVDLDRREREVLAHIEQHFPSAEFSRAQLAESMGWAVNRITGRVLGLIEKGRLTEDDARTVECPVTQGRAHPVKLKGFSTEGGSNGQVRARNGNTERSLLGAAGTSAANQRAGGDVGCVPVVGVHAISGLGEADDAVVTPDGRSRMQSRRSGSDDMPACEQPARHDGQVKRARPAHQSDAPAPRNLVAVIPALFGRPSLSLESANRIVKDSGNAFLAEANRVREIGEHWVWS